VRPQGYGLHGHDTESCGDTHRVAPGAVAELKAQTEAMFHMYYFVLADGSRRPQIHPSCQKACTVHMDPILKYFDNLEGLN
jgi:hypothetical protein